MGACASSIQDGVLTSSPASGYGLKSSQKMDVSEPTERTTANHESDISDGTKGSKEERTHKGQKKKKKATRTVKHEETASKVESENVEYSQDDREDDDVYASEMENSENFGEDYLEALDDNWQSTFTLMVEEDEEDDRNLEAGRVGTLAPMKDTVDWKKEPMPVTNHLVSTSLPEDGDMSSHSVPKVLRSPSKHSRDMSSIGGGASLHSFYNDDSIAETMIKDPDGSWYEHYRDTFVPREKSSSPRRRDKPNGRNKADNEAYQAYLEHSVGPEHLTFSDFLKQNGPKQPQRQWSSDEEEEDEESYDDYDNVGVPASFLALKNNKSMELTLQSRGPKEYPPTLPKRISTGSTHSRRISHGSDHSRLPKGSFHSNETDDDYEDEEYHRHGSLLQLPTHISSSVTNTRRSGSHQVQQSPSLGTSTGKTFSGMEFVANQQSDPAISPITVTFNPGHYKKKLLSSFGPTSTMPLQDEQEAEKKKNREGTVLDLENNMPHVSPLTVVTGDLDLSGHYINGRKRFELSASKRQILIEKDDPSTSKSISKQEKKKTKKKKKDKKDKGKNRSRETNAYKKRDESSANTSKRKTKTPKAEKKRTEYDDSTVDSLVDRPQHLPQQEKKRWDSQDRSSSRYSIVDNTKKRNKERKCDSSNEDVASNPTRDSESEGESERPIVLIRGEKDNKTGIPRKRRYRIIRYQSGEGSILRPNDDDSDDNSSSDAPEPANKHSQRTAASRQGKMHFSERKKFWSCDPVEPKTCEADRKTTKNSKKKKKKRNDGSISSKGTKRSKDSKSSRSKRKSRKHSQTD